jgi:hypothetical protein
MKKLALTLFAFGISQSIIAQHIRLNKSNIDPSKILFRSKKKMEKMY